MFGKYLLHIALFLIIFSCSKKEQENVVTPNAKDSVGNPLSFPEYLEAQPGLKDYHSNLEVIALGKKLFFDKRLSKDSSVSCASCHMPEKAFTDGIALNNVGVSGEKLPRNAPSLINIGWHTSFFWDGGAKDLESQSLGPLTAENEMAADLETLIALLNKNAEYKAIFGNAFTSEEIKINHLMKAFAAFERSLLGFNSKYDHVLQEEASFTISEQKGYKLVQRHCATCHKEPLFSSFGFKNNGLDTEFNYEPEDPRLGRARVTRDNEDLGKYKIPSLRNLNFTAPYMHDGRIETLEKALEHYSENIQTSSTLSEEIPPTGFDFTSEEINDILNFLNTLNDENLTSE